MYFLPGVSNLRLDLGAAHTIAWPQRRPVHVVHDRLHLCPPSLICRHAISTRRMPSMQGSRIVAARDARRRRSDRQLRQVDRRAQCSRCHRWRRRASTRAPGPWKMIVLTGPDQVVVPDPAAVTSAAYLAELQSGEGGAGEHDRRAARAPCGTGPAPACCAGTRSSASSWRGTTCRPRRAPTAAIRCPTPRIRSPIPPSRSPTRPTRRAPTAT